jgi:hypothetical protein
MKARLLPLGDHSNGSFPVITLIHGGIPYSEGAFGLLKVKVTCRCNPESFIQDSDMRNLSVILRKVKRKEN